MGDDSKPVEFSTGQLEKVFKAQQGVNPAWLVLLVAMNGGSLLYNPNANQLDAIATELRQASNAVREIKGGLDAVDVDVRVLEKRVQSLEKDLDHRIQGLEEDLDHLRERVGTNATDIRLVKRILPAPDVSAITSGNPPGK